MRNFKHNSENVLRKLNNMDQVMDIEKLNEFSLLKQEFGKVW